MRAVPVVRLCGHLDEDALVRAADVLRDAIARGGSDQVICDVEAMPQDDMGSVEALARLQLLARQLGSAICVRSGSDRLEELVGLAGLTEELPMYDRPMPGGSDGE